MNAHMDFDRLAGRLETDSDAYEANLALGMLLYRRGEFEDALKRLIRAANLRESTELFTFTGALARETGDMVMAERMLSRAAAIGPDDFDAQVHYGRHLALEGRMDVALPFLEKALTLRPQDYELLNDLGVVHFSMGNHLAAKKALEEAIGAVEHTENADTSQKNGPRANLGFVLLAMGKPHEARRMAEMLAQDGGEEESRRLLEAIDAPAPEQGARHIPSEKASCLGGISPMSMIQNFGECAKGESPTLSIIIPVYNEAGNLPQLFDELQTTVNGLEDEAEIIFVNDGSTDNSGDILEELSRRDQRVRVIDFRRNYGQTAALSAGFKYCRGDIIVTLDGDLQNDPRDIPRLLAKMAEGHDLVNGWRKNRKDAALTRRLPSWTANRIINKLIEGTGVQLNDFGCTLKAYKRGIVKNIRLYGEMHRFIPVFAAWLGVSVAEIEVSHRPRVHGEAKYGLSRVLRVILDLIVVRFFADYVTRPIQFFGKIALLTTGAGLGVTLLLAGLKALFTLPISWGILLVLAALSAVSGLHIVFMGLIGELLVRSYFEGQHKDQYVVRRVIGG